MTYTNQITGFRCRKC